MKTSPKLQRLLGQADAARARVSRYSPAEREALSQRWQAALRTAPRRPGPRGR